MPRTKSPDPVLKLSLTIPKSLARMSKNVARARHLSLSAFMTALIREYFQNVEKALR